MGQRLEQPTKQQNSSKGAGLNLQNIQFPGAEVMPGVRQNGNGFTITDQRLGRPEVVQATDLNIYLVYPNEDTLPAYVKYTVGPKWSSSEIGKINQAVDILERYFGKNDPTVQELKKQDKILPRLYEIGIGTPEDFAPLSGSFTRSSDPSIDRKIFLPRHLARNLVELTFILAEEGFHSQDKQIDIEKSSLSPVEAKRRAELRALGKREELYNKIISGNFPSEWLEGLEMVKRGIERGNINLRAPSKSK